MTNESKNTTVVKPEIAYPLDRFFTCTIEGRRGLPETFYYNPATDEAHVIRAGYEITITFLADTDDSSKVVPILTFPKGIDQQLLLAQEAIKYRPTDEELLEIMPSQMYGSLIGIMDKIFTEDIICGKDDAKLNSLTNSITFATMGCWKKSLEGTPFENIMISIEKRIIGEIVDEFIAVCDDKSSLIKKYLPKLQNNLKDFGYNGYVTKLNQALQA